MPVPMLTTFHAFSRLSFTIILWNEYANSPYFTVEEKQAPREKVTVQSQTIKK